MADERYGYSYDEERYHGDFATREEAVAEAFDAEECTVVWTARRIPVEIRIPAYGVLERVCEDMYEQCGEVCDGWLEKVPKEQEKDLERRLSVAFTEWLAAHKLTPTFWTADDIEEHRRSTPAGRGDSNVE